MNAGRLYVRYAGISIRSQMQYRGSFLMSSLGLFVVTAGEFFGIWALFDRFGAVKGWSLAEVALFYGLVHLAFALAEFFGRGFDEFSLLVKSGRFDALLLRPRSTALQVAAGTLPLHRVGRFAFALTVLLWSLSALEVSWTPGRLGLLALALLGGACMFCGLFVFQATLSFWTVETLEVMNILTYGGTETGQYPLSIYRPWFRRLFTFLVPLACVSYFPILAVLDRPDPVFHTPKWLQALSPVAGGLFLAISLLAWRAGVRHYRSTGS